MWTDIFPGVILGTTSTYNEPPPQKKKKCVSGVFKDLTVWNVSTQKRNLSWFHLFLRAWAVKQWISDSILQSFRGVIAMVPLQRQPQTHLSLLCFQKLKGQSRQKHANNLCHWGPALVCNSTHVQWAAAVCHSLLRKVKNETGSV